MVALLPKKDGDENITVFRPISLINSFAKLLSKALSLRLVAHIDKLISPSQSAFLKTKCIHDSFLYV